MALTTSAPGSTRAQAPENPNPQPALAIPPPPAAPPPQLPQPTEQPRPTVSAVFCYRNQNGEQREVVIYERPEQSTLVIDRNNESHADLRLVGEIPTDEPEANARLLACMWAGCPLEKRHIAVYTGELPHVPEALPTRLAIDEVTYRIALVAREHGPGNDLRWVIERPGRPAVVTTLRQVVAAFEAYEPATAMSNAAIELTPEEVDGGHAVLARELNRVRSSRRILNRGLREAVQAEVARGTSLAEIAARCGRVEIVKGASKGESSWVARRVGLAGDGHGVPRRWIDRDVLVQIAAAISLTPADVEL